MHSSDRSLYEYSAYNFGQKKYKKPFNFKNDFAETNFYKMINRKKYAT